MTWSLYLQKGPIKTGQIFVRRRTLSRETADVQIIWQRGLFSTMPSNKDSINDEIPLFYSVEKAAECMHLLKHNQHPLWLPGSARDAEFAPPRFHVIG